MIGDTFDLDVETLRLKKAFTRDEVLDILLAYERLLREHEAQARFYTSEEYLGEVWQRGYDEGFSDGEDQAVDEAYERGVAVNQKQARCGS